MSLMLLLGTCTDAGTCWAVCNVRSTLRFFSPNTPVPSHGVCGQERAHLPRVRDAALLCCRSCVRPTRRCAGSLTRRTRASPHWRTQQRRRQRQQRRRLSSSATAGSRSGSSTGSSCRRSRSRWVAGGLLGLTGVSDSCSACGDTGHVCQTQRCIFCLLRLCRGFKR
jgi:hypothetical protein